jgi:hypothetical protein
MFVVQPFRKEPSIRSVLGFMSIATRWGDYLFPGITVLTRDLHDVQAMHLIAVEMSAWKPHHRHEFQTSKTDQKIARRLSQILGKKGIHRKPETLVQKMSYWQRYGSLFDHFDLLTEKRAFSVEKYRRMIFDPEQPGPGKDDEASRKRRIRHFRWYNRYCNRILDNLDEYDDVSLGLQGRAVNWKRWWLTGRHAPDGVPQAICLARELEFFFTVWQTLFEASALLVHDGGRIPSPWGKSVYAIEQFIQLTVKLRSKYQFDDCKRLIGACFLLHERFIQPRLARWEREVKGLLDSDFDSFVKLHNRETIAEFGQRDGIDFLESLSQLHLTYCNLQNKLYARCIKSFRKRIPGLKIPRFSAEFTRNRWGLFGYRFGAAVGLYSSKKYDRDTLS